MSKLTRMGALVLGAALMLAAIAPARAQCSSMCTMYQSGECVQTTETCTPYVPPAPNFGAIAYGRKSGAYGYSYAWDTQAEAEKVAMKNCADNGKDCEVIVWFQRTCAAVASGKGTNAYWALGDGEGAARENVMAQCAKAGGGKDCAVQVSTCSR